MYTNDQYKMMEKLERGYAHKWWRDADDDATIRFLSSSGLAAAAEDQGEGRWRLTAEGQRQLSEYRRYYAEQIQQEAKEQAREAKRLEERHEDHAREERHHRTQNKIAIANIIVSILCFVAGLLVEHWTGLIERIVS